GGRRGLTGVLRVPAAAGRRVGPASRIAVTGRSAVTGRARDGRSGVTGRGDQSGRRGQPVYGLTSSTVTLMVAPVGVSYCLVSPLRAPVSARPSGDCAE